MAHKPGSLWCADCGTEKGPLYDVRADPPLGWVILCAGCLQKQGADAQNGARVVKDGE